MKYLVLIFLPIIALGLNPYEPGSYQTKHKLIYGFLNNGLNHELDVWAPITAPGEKLPVFYFLGGLGGIIPGIAYTQVLERIASHGILVVFPWALQIPEYSGTWIDEVIEWVENNLENKFHEDGLYFDMDEENIFISGHSAGAHVVVANLLSHCGKIKGQILMSPVDGYDPFGLIDDFVITPGELVCYDTPTLVLICGLDEVPGFNTIGDIMPACAPHKLSNMRFYDAMPGPTWIVNATAYGHADFLDPTFQDIVQAIHFCATNKDADQSVYRHFTSGQVVAFISTLYHGDCEGLAYLEDTSVMPVATAARKKGDTDSVCGNLYCNWDGL